MNNSNLDSSKEETLSNYDDEIEKLSSQIIPTINKLRQVITKKLTGHNPDDLLFAVDVSKIDNVSQDFISRNKDKYEFVNINKNRKLIKASSCLVVQNKINQQLGI